MKNNLKTIFIWVIAITIPTLLTAKSYTLLSPDKKIEATISTDNATTISIKNSGRQVLKETNIGLIIDGTEITEASSPIKETRRSYGSVIEPIVKFKSDKLVEAYNELTIKFKNNFSIQIRAYDEGIAYRFQTAYKNDITVDNEILNLVLPENSMSYLQKERSYLSSYEVPYVCEPAETFEENTLICLPALFKTESGDFLLVSESDIKDYPGMWFTKKNGVFESILPQVATKTKTDNCVSEQFVTERADYIAKTTGTRDYPWRILAIADEDAKLITNQLVYLLATPAPDKDYSWIEPGIATLDWWGRRNIFGTDFKGGVNTETFKYFIDFNSTNGIKYFVMDDGWSNNCDFRDINANVDLDEVKRYAEEKGVSLIFWLHGFVLKQDIAGNLDFIKSKGAKGIKVDFFNRDDQEVINLLHDIAREAEKRELVIDFHGVCKPFGLSRTYPNVLTSEGLIEFEMNGGSDWANPKHHTLLPFIRMTAGPMDYLPATLNNAQREQFYHGGNRPVGLGTRSHSIALSVVFESAITMIPDSPADYIKEPECTKFLSSIPVVWDETKVIDAKVGEYVVIARRSGEDWFLAAITNWDARDIDVKLDFLSDGTYNAEYLEDGANSATRAIDYKKCNKKVDATSDIKMKLTTGGGWVGKISKH